MAGNLFLQTFKRKTTDNDKAKSSVSNIKVSKNNYCAKNSNKLFLQAQKEISQNNQDEYARRSLKNAIPRQANKDETANTNVDHEQIQDNVIENSLYQNYTVNSADKWLQIKIKRKVRVMKQYQLVKVTDFKF